MEPVGALGKRATLRRDGAPRDRVGGQGTHDKHLSVLDYKKEQRAKEVAALETVMVEKESQVEGQERRLKELAPAVKNMERLAAEFSADRR